MDTSSGLSPVLGGAGAIAANDSITPTLPQASVAAPEPNDAQLWVKATPETSRYSRLDIYLGDKLIGEYERSIEREIERKCGEIRLAAEVLIDVFQRRSAFQVRWNGDTRTKDIRVNGVTVGAVPRDCWLPPSR